MNIQNQIDAINEAVSMMNPEDQESILICKIQIIAVINSFGANGNIALALVGLERSL